MNHKNVSVPGRIEIDESDYNHLLTYKGIHTAEDENDWCVVLCPAHNDKNPSLRCLLSAEDIEAEETTEEGYVVKKLIEKYYFSVSCRTGCTAEEVYRDFGIDYPTKVTSYWDYVDANDAYIRTKIKYETLYQRKDRKKFYSIRIRQSNGEYIAEKELKKSPDYVPRPDVLYNLPRVLAETGDVFIVEGEKCSDAMLDREFTATTNCYGGGNWNGKELNPQLAHAKRIIIIPDQDKTGQNHFYKVARSLLEFGYEEVYHLDLPGLEFGSKDDVYDWFERGNTADGLKLIPLEKIRLEDLPAESSFSSSKSQPKWLEKLEVKTLKTDSSKKVITPVLNNYVVILQHHPLWKDVFAYNKLKGVTVKLRAPLPYVKEGDLCDKDLVEIKLWMHDEYRELNPSKEALADAILAIGDRNAFNPLADYFDNLPAWDGIPRLERLLIRCAGAEDSKYTRMVTKKWFIGAVARGLNPGCKMDYSLCIVGTQGYGKTTFLKTIALRNEWYSDEANKVDNKDLNLITSSKWIIEFGEMSSMKKSDINDLKQFLSRTCDEWRRPYDRYLTFKPRGCVFVFTGNNTIAFLADSTGNRRYWPLEITKPFDLDYVEKRKEEIWAEALFYYKAGEKWHPETDEEHALCGEAQERYYLPDSEEEHLRDFLKAYQFDSILTSEIRDRLNISDRRINSIMADRFKCTYSKNLGANGKKGTSRGYIINREVLPVGSAQVTETPSSYRIDPRGSNVVDMHKK